MISGGDEIVNMLDPKTGEEILYETEEMKREYIEPLDSVLLKDNCIALK